MSSLSEWWAEIPPVTRFLFASAGITTLGANFGFFPFAKLILIPSLIIKQFQIWRLFTSFACLGGLGLPFLFDMLFIYQYSGSLERQHFSGRIADYVFMILFGMGGLLAIGSYFEFPLLGQALIMFILYNWSRKNAEAIMSFFFGLRFKGIYLPWVLVAFNVLLGGSPKGQLAGIVIGHIYFFLTEVWPAQGGPRLLQTPRFMLNLFPTNQREQGYRAFQPQNNNNNNQNNQRGGYNWGTGRVLGRDN